MGACREVGDLPPNVNFASHSPKTRHCPPPGSKAADRGSSAAHAFRVSPLDDLTLLSPLERVGRATATRELAPLPRGRLRQPPVDRTWYLTPHPFSTYEQVGGEGAKRTSRVRSAIPPAHPARRRERAWSGLRPYSNVGTPVDPKSEEEQGPEIPIVKVKAPGKIKSAVKKGPVAEKSKATKKTVPARVSPSRHQRRRPSHPRSARTRETVLNPVMKTSQEVSPNEAEFYMENIIKGFSKKSVVDPTDSVDESDEDIKHRVHNSDDDYGSDMEYIEIDKPRPKKAAKGPQIQYDHESDDSIPDASKQVVSAARQQKANVEVRVPLPDPRKLSKVLKAQLERIAGASADADKCPESEWHISARLLFPSKELKAVLCGYIEFIKLSLLFEDSIISCAGFARACAIAAVKHSTSVHIKERLETDMNFAALLVDIGDMKRIAARIAPLPAPAVKTLVYDLIQDHWSIFPVDPTTVIISLLKKGVFTEQFKTKNPHLFASTSKKHPEDLELPEPLICLAATADYGPWWNMGQPGRSRRSRSLKCNGDVVNFQRNHYFNFQCCGQLCDSHQPCRGSRL
ncbi:hypothetical protein DFH07DRAFT_783644 [Mycena maculata]|uniref:Uncharacterized protein n=1 Tax=Mycena maculata TaxID=230809 RepID=A0AAD7HMF6_9AGAR|nr:hypothetical protein DFH07DRAFT_783644 [Mycena maculata]